MKAGRSAVGTATATVSRPQRSGLRRFIAVAGPAFVAAVAYIDPGNVATNVAAGSSEGYRLLWVILWSNLIAILFQSMAAKLGIATNRGLSQCCRDQFSRPVSIGLWLVSEVAAMATDL